MYGDRQLSGKHVCRLLLLFPVSRSSLNLNGHMQCDHMWFWLLVVCNNIVASFIHSQSFIEIYTCFFVSIIINVHCKGISQGGCSSKWQVVFKESQSTSGWKGPLEVMWASPCSEMVLLDQVAEDCVPLSYGWRAISFLHSFFQSAHPHGVKCFSLHLTGIPDASPLACCLLSFHCTSLRRI